MSNFISAFLYRLAALTFACAVLTGATAEKEATDGLTAEQILEKMATTYATCKSYRDSGVVTHDLLARFPRYVVKKPFRTAFVRPDQFRFQYDDPTPEKPYIVWAKAGEVHSWWYIKPGVQSPPSLWRGVAGATGVSGGSAHTVPALLLPDQIGGRKLKAMTELERLPDETLDGTPCLKLQGKLADHPMTLWLEITTYLLRRIDETTARTRDTTVYCPEVDKEIPAKELEFNAPNQH